MKRLYLIRILMALMLLTAASSASAADRLYLSSTTVEPGESKQLEFILENEQPYYGFQADITLPQGLTFGQSATIAITERCGTDFSIVSNQTSDRTLRVGIFSTSHTFISGNDGALMSITVQAADDFAGGEFTITDIHFIADGDVDTPLPDFISNFGSVYTNNLLITDFTIGTEETKEIALILENETPFTAFQTDIYLPEELIFVEDSPKLSFRGNSEYTLTAKNFDEGRTRIVCFNTSTTPFSGKSGILVTFEVTATKITAEKDVEIHVKNSIFSTSDAREYLLPATTCNVHITFEEPSINPPTNPTIKVTPTEVVLTEGDTFVLKAELTDMPEDAGVVWTSENGLVATVDAEGIVTAIAEGETAVTATCNGLSASAHVVVNRRLVPAITVTPDAVELTEGDTFVLTAELTDMPEDAVAVWISENELVATVDAEGTITAIAEGETTVTATCNGLSASAHVIVKAKQTGDPDEGGIDGIEGDEAVEVYDLKGMKVADSLDRLPKGVYIVSKGGKTTKVVI